MHACIGHYTGMCATENELILAARQLAVALNHVSGFVSYALLDMGDGALMSVSVFESRLELDTGNEVIAAWMAEHLPTLTRQPTSAEVGEIILQRGM